MTSDGRTGQAEFQKAVQYLNSGSYKDCERLCLLLLQRHPSHPDFNHILALSYRAQGNFQGAEKAIKRALSQSKDHPAILNNFGLILMDQGKAVKASKIFAKAIKNDPGMAAAHTNLGHVQRMLNRPRDAEARYREALRLDSNSSDALIQLALLLRNEKRLSDLGVSLSLPNGEFFNEPGLAMVQGLIALDENVPKVAEAAFRHALKQQPRSALLWTNLGLSLSKQNRLEESRKAYEEAIQIDPNLPEVRINIADLLKYDSPQLARDHLHEAIRMEPNNKSTHDVLGFTWFMNKEHDAAIDCFTHALEIDQNFEQAAAHRAGAHFLKGDFSAAWQDYNRKYGSNGTFGSPVSDTLPLWSQDSLPDGPILIWTDQGPGDEILQLGYIADIRDRAFPLVIATSERLVPIAARSFPEATCVSVDSIKSNGLNAVQPIAQCPAMQVAALCWRSFDDHPERMPYLLADESETRSIRERYKGTSGGNLLVGISWRSTNAEFGDKKSLHLSDLLPILTHSDLTFVDLQYGETEEEIAALPLDIQNKIIRDEGVDPLKDMDQFASQVRALDLVITTSNTTAHAAGAMGCKTWTLVPRVGPGWLWYWFDDRADSPWYTQMRLFRQSTAGDWAPPLADMQANLPRFIKEFQSLTGN